MAQARVTLSIRVPENLNTQMEQHSQRTGQDKTALVNQLLVQFFAQGIQDATGTP